MVMTAWTVEYPFIGKVQHLKNPSITRIREFFSKYYVPSNMALTLAGDLDYDKTIRLVRKYFSPFPSGKGSPGICKRHILSGRMKSLQSKVPKPDSS